MRPLPAPAIAVSDVLTDCITGADSSLQPRLESIRNSLIDREVAYRAAAKGTALHTLPRDLALDLVTADELKALYPDHLSATKGKARAHYNAIRNVKHNRCPLCGAAAIAHLDHHLPKSRYPDLAILPINLVPACHFCNVAKGSKFPSSAEEQTLHPYFDGHLVGQWLTARVDRGPPVTMIFDTIRPPNWNALDAQRAHRHFTVLKLSINYASNAADELGPLREHLKLTWLGNNPDPIKAHLIEQMNKYQKRPNSWQFALYQALQADEWFINGGFLEIQYQETDEEEDG